jgi:predicted N-acetyltransferase YhbS
VAYYKRFGFTVAGYDEWEMGGEPFTWWVMVAQ